MTKPMCPNCKQVDHGAMLSSDHGGRFYFTRCGNCNHGFMYNAKGEVQNSHEEPRPSNVLVSELRAEIGNPDDSGAPYVNNPDLLARCLTEIERLQKVERNAVIEIHRQRDEIIKLMGDVKDDDGDSSSHEPCTELEEWRRLKTDRHAAHIACLRGVIALHPDDALHVGGTSRNELDALRASQPPSDAHDINALLDVARDTSSLDCFYTGSTCEPGCECLSARASKAITPRHTVTKAAEL